MDRNTKSELLKTIESQNEKIGKYERKLRDVVGAYKGLQKEKEALEASVKVLSAAANASSKETNGETGNIIVYSNWFQGEVHCVNGGAFAPSEASDAGSEDSAVASADVQALRSQLATLSSSLATVTHEKSKMEAIFLAEKKQIRQDHELAVEKYEGMNAELKQNVEKLTDELQKVRASFVFYQRSKLREQQHEREKEQDDHAVMLRELQKLLAVERMAKEHIEQQTDELRTALSEAKSRPKVSDQYEVRIQELGQEIGSLREQLANEKDRAKRPSPELNLLKQQLEKEETDHKAAMRAEQDRSRSSQQRLENLATQHEERVSSLENKLSELSEATGQYERQHHHDQLNIQKLKERINQLDAENMALTKTGHMKSAEQEDDGVDVQQIVDKIVVLKKSLMKANERLEKPMDIEELLKIDAMSFDHESFHVRCREEFNQLKEEFERYKLRAQSVLKNKSTKESVTSNKEVDALKQQVTELKDRLRHIRLSNDDLETNLADREEHFRKTLSTLSSKHKVELASAEAEQKQQLGEMELEMRKHRDRTIALLAEKDRELEVLRSLHSVERFEQQYISQFSPHRQTSQTSSVDLQEAGASSEETSVSELLARTSLTPGNSSETSLLFFAQEQARKDVEINTLRRQKHMFEQTLREVTQDFTMKLQLSHEQVESLQEEIRKLERNKSRESANLEYLKNVVYHFMICQDAIGKEQMCNAIATILEFSPRERQKVETELTKGWWTYNKAAASP
ncbi:hypothetical protein CAPTEDRAFT_214083 [Capitella teleta]|uniref:GRIP domain-containing protein n=1 Tax=Capitella teleta TaxID=283909 RepID=R7TK69_CAPTE|nr:hypothetical protein CAPTEDRAFT_214083 [Capitella teleta]|eukprot:ELT94109.1 hypothetical protein CAPTEDRAFT_214083 [Capitella teleta]